MNNIQKPSNFQTIPTVWQQLSWGLHNDSSHDSNCHDSYYRENYHPVQTLV